VENQAKRNQDQIPLSLAFETRSRTALVEMIISIIDSLIREWQAANRHFIYSLAKYQRAHQNAHRLGRFVSRQRAILISGLDVAEKRYDEARRAWQATDDRLQAHFCNSDIIQRFYITGGMLGSKPMRAANDNGRRVQIR